MDNNRCGAKKRDGTPCKCWPIKGAARCRIHGGKSTGPPKGSRNALKYGIYSAGIKESEKELWGQIQVGTLDDEIKILKLQLTRAVQAQKEFEEEFEANGHKERDIDQVKGFEYDSIEIKSEFVGKGEDRVLVDEKKIIKKRPDFRAIIYRLSGRIGKLELTRDVLTKGDKTNEPVTLIMNMGGK